MKKLFLILSVFVLFSFTPNVNSISIETNTAIEEVSVDCNSLAQGYYEFLVNEEGVSPREAGRRARRLRDSCKKSQKEDLNQQQ